MTPEIVYESPNSRVLVGSDNELGKYILKILNQEYPRPKKVKQFLNEYEILKDLAIPGVRRVLKIEKRQDRYALYLEYIEGLTIKKFIATKPSLIDRLKVAISMADVLSGVHAENIIHKDFTAENIIVNPEKRTVSVIDFGIASNFVEKKQFLGNPDKLEGTLNYISPEQTGRMNRTVDYRTDIYALGVVLFELFTGRLPFVEEDAMRLVHAHIAMPPPRAGDHAQIPAVLSKIIGKLLQKTAEARYQSAPGVRHDLEKCLALVESGNVSEEFELGEKDKSAKFSLAEKLYGRDEELNSLLSSFEMVHGGAAMLYLIAGYSGTGKSALVHEIHKPVTERRAFFIEGKFDQYSRAVPYYAILQAFNSLINLLLTEPEHKLEYFRQQILDAVGEEGAVLIEVLPHLELIIGKQPDVIEVGGAEAQNRFNYVFRNFVNAICSQMHPLVLFVDDLQWADSSSLTLLQNILQDTEAHHFLCICAYRDNEVGPDHPFIMAVNQMQRNKVTIHGVSIGNLSEENVCDLIADSIFVERSMVRDLASLIYQRTGGNAFFVTQFLKSLNEEGLLAFNLHQGQWEWDNDKIKRQDLGMDVVSLMGGKVRRLLPETQKALRLASCIGNRFELDTLAVILGSTNDETASQLLPAIQDGLIIEEETYYKFVHDKIQQAVYSLIPETERNQLHLRIGRLLLSNYNDEQLEENLFDVVNQLNFGVDIIQDGEELEKLIALNISAALKAKHSTAYDEAFDYAEQGIELLPPDPWKTKHRQSYDLYLLRAETAFLSNRFDAAYASVDTLLANTENLLDRVKPYEVRLQALKAENKLRDALDTGLEVLKELGENFPKKTRMPHVVADLIKTQMALRGKSQEDLLALPPISDPIKMSAMSILANIAPSSYWADPSIFPLIFFRIVRLSIKYGCNGISAWGLATYGVIMLGAFGQTQVGVRYGKIGLSVLNKFYSKEWVAHVYTSVYALINLWNEPVRNTLKPLLDSYHVGLEAGAIEFACVNSNIYCIHAFMIGHPLEKLEAETEGYSLRFRQFNQQTNLKYNEVYRQAMLNFMGKAEDVFVLTGAAFDEEEMMRQNLERKDRTGTILIYFLKSMLGVFFRNPELAWENARLGRSLLDAILAKFEVSNFHFYEALAACQVYEVGGKYKSNAILKRVRSNISKMKGWAKHAPENYYHKFALMQAEYYRISGLNTKARLFYDLAIQRASESEDYVHEQALANELAGRFHHSNGFERLGDFHLKNAYQLYREWEAKEKMARLEQEFPEILFHSAGAQRRKVSKSTSVSTSISTYSTISESKSLDLTTIFKAAEIISGELVLDNLIVTMMEILAENVGSTKGYLLQEKDLKLYIQAEIQGTKVLDEIRTHIPVEQSKKLPLTIIHYVTRTGEAVVVDNALIDERFENDPYIREHKPLSIMVYPIVSKGSRLGLLYFENSLAEGVFTEERFELLSLLSGQIAISIENALLYESLEQKVQERTLELSEEKKKSDNLLLNILPDKTADELKKFGSAKPRRYESVTVMFTDFKDFTNISKTLSAEQLVRVLGEYFAGFDQIMAKYGIEKIKTIGDSYMCVAGLPEPSEDHAARMIMAALELQDFLKKQQEESKARGEPYFAMRIGMHSGPVVAGVVGLHKFAYDIWGDTVNLASRMESACEVGHINVTEATKILLENQFEFQSRGEISVKNIPNLKMYYLIPPAV